MTCPAICQCKGRSEHIEEDARTCPCGGAIVVTDIQEVPIEVKIPERTPVECDIWIGLFGPDPLDMS